MKKIYKRFIPILLVILLFISGCSQNSTSEKTDANAIISDPVKYDSDDTYSDWQNDEATYIHLNGNTATTIGRGGVVLKGSQILIRTTGTYVIDGVLKDGQIIIDAENSGTVRLVLNGAEINSSTSSPIYVKQADKTVISLEENTENIISDAAAYVYENEENDEPEAAIFSKDDLTINGTGTLKVAGNYKDGITSRDELKITGGTLEITAADDGIVGRDLFAMKDANITVTAGGNGVKASNDEDESKGNIVLENGSLNVTADGDGIEAENALTVIEGEYSIIAGGGSPDKIETDEFRGGFQIEADPESMQQLQENNEDPPVQPQAPSNSEPPQGFTDNRQSNTVTEDAESEDTVSTKGLKAGTSITIASGTLKVDSLEDAVHSDQEINITGGTLNLSTGDDGLDAELDVTVNGGSIDIEKSLEGIEGLNITISDGNIHLYAEDDGINVNGNDSELGLGDMEMKNPGNSFRSDEAETLEDTPQTGETVESDTANSEKTSNQSQLLIEGGYLYVNANGDGLDSNGSIKMTGGTVIVYGPNQSMNGSLDYSQSFIIEGGILVASGSSGMAQGISEDSKQNAVMMSFSEFQQSGTAVYVEDSNGGKIFAIAPEKEFQTILISTPELKTDQSYTISTDGVLSGDNTDGYFSSNTEYKDGIQTVDFTLSAVMTYLDESGVTESPTTGGFAGPRGERPAMDSRETFNYDQNNEKGIEGEDDIENQ